MAGACEMKPNERVARLCAKALCAWLLATACGDQTRVAAPTVRPIDGAAHGVSSSGYTATELPPAPGYNNAAAHDLNAASVIVGFSYTDPGPERATKWVNGQPVLLPLYPNQFESQAWAINAAGRIVGKVELNAGGSDSRAVLWTGNSVSALPFVGNSAGAEDINDAGVIVGWEYDRNGIRAVKWIDGGRVSLHPPGAYLTWAYGVNSAGDVVGMYRAVLNTEEVPIVWRADGSWFTLPSPPGGIECFGTDINQSLSVIGWCTLAGNAFAWRPETGSRDLGWGFGSVASALSSRHRAVGAGDGGALTQHQTIVDTLPNPAGATSAYATGVNTCGSTVGVFFKPNGSHGAVLWTKPTCDPLIGPS